MSEAARKAFEMLPATYEYQDGSLRRSFLKGRTSTVISFLKARGIELTEADEEKIAACHQPAQLECLIAKAATVESAAELFE